METQAAAIGGLLALGGVIAGSLVTLSIERRRAAGQLRVALFEHRYAAYAEVLAALSDVHDWMVQVCGNLGPRALTGSDLATFAEEGAVQTNRVTAAIQRNSLAMDRSGMGGLLQYLGMIHAVAEKGEALPTNQELGDRFGQAIAACHRSLSIPELARETYREAAQLGGGRKSRTS